MIKILILNSFENLNDLVKICTKGENLAIEVNIDKCKVMIINEDKPEQITEIQCKGKTFEIVSKMAKSMHNWQIV